MTNETTMSASMTPADKLPLLHQRMDWLGMSIVDMCIFREESNPHCPYAEYIENAKASINSLRVIICLEEKREKKRLQHLETLPLYLRQQG